jgi:hypothetical protein
MSTILRSFNGLKELLMQRIATLSILILVLPGCASSQVNSPTRGRSKHEAQPALTRSRPARPRYVHRPLPPLPAPLPKRNAQSPPSTSGELGDLTPPGGFARGQWSTIVVHHSAGADDTVESMDRFHRDVRKWDNGLGYHFVIGNGVKTADGKIYAGSRWRRQITGAHCHNPSGRFFGTWRPNNFFNTHGIGICLIGNFEQTSPTARQMAALEQLSRFLCTELQIPPGMIHGHGQVTGRTACPGVALEGRLAGIRQAVARETARAPRDRSWPDDDLSVLGGSEPYVSRAGGDTSSKIIDRQHALAVDLRDGVSNFDGRATRAAARADIDDSQTRGNGSISGR